MALLNNRGKVYLGDTLISGLPELTNKGSATDLAYGKELIDQNGNVVTGTLGEATNGLKVMGKFAEMIGTPGATTFNVTATYLAGSIGDNTTGCILRPGALLTPRNIPTNLFGDARLEDVAKGKKFTSAAGLLVEGTLKDDGELSLTGGTASASFSMEILPGGVTSTSSMDISLSANANTDRIIRAGDKVCVSAKGDEFGDAKAEDVRAGKTFTSVAGLKDIGTMEVVDYGQYCWKKYAANKSYELTTESLGTTQPDDCDARAYYSYTITDDGYFQLNSDSVSINLLYLPSGASNGKTKYIYYAEWKYALSGSYYKYSRLTLSDTYTEEKSAFLGYVISNESTEYPEDGIAADGYWYVLISNS